MTTPAKHMERAVEKCCRLGHCEDGACERCTAAAIRAAIAETREECAKIAESFPMLNFAARKKLAAAIRGQR